MIIPFQNFALQISQASNFSVNGIGQDLKKQNQQFQIHLSQVIHLLDARAEPLERKIKAFKYWKSLHGPCMDTWGLSLNQMVWAIQLKSNQGKNEKIWKFKREFSKNSTRN